MKQQMICTVLALALTMSFAACKEETPPAKESEKTAKKSSDEEWHVFEWGKPATYQFGDHVETMNFEDFSIKFAGKHSENLKNNYRLETKAGDIDVGLETTVTYLEFEVSKDSKKKKIRYYGPLVDEKRHQMVCEPGAGDTAIGVRQCALADPLSDLVPCTFKFGDKRYMLEMEPSVTPDLFLDENQVAVWTPEAFKEKTGKNFPPNPPPTGLQAPRDELIKDGEK